MPRLAEGLELIGEYEGSGFKQTPYLARRMDGQVLQLTRLLYLVAEAVDGERGFARIAEEVTWKFGRTVSADNVEFLVEKKLRPLGVLTAADGTSPKMEKAAPMLSLSLRTRLVPERAVRAITTLFYPLFHWPVVLLVLGGLVALDAWLFFVHGVAQSARELAYQPVLFLMVFGLVVLSAAFHECGHATACRYGGARPGALGAGLYLVYPAFFSDVTDVYRLGKWGRVRTDLGGIYFNVIFSLLTAGVYFLTGFEPLLAVIVVQHFEILHQLLPFLRLDGYYVVSDLTGVPDLFARIRPILRSLAPWRKPDAAVTALKPWVRVVVTAWVISVVPTLLYLLGVTFVAVPRLLATARDSLSMQYDKAASAFSDGQFLVVLADAIQIVFLILPLAGLTYTFGRIGQRLGVAAWTRTEGKPVLRTGLASVALLSVGLLAFAWWPHNEEPIQPGERGTVQESLGAIGDTVQENLEPISSTVRDTLEPIGSTVRDGLESVGEHLPTVIRTSLAAEQKQGPGNVPTTGERPGSPIVGSPTGTGGAGEPARRMDQSVPAGEQPSGAQQSKQGAGEHPGSPTGTGGTGEPSRRPDQPASAGEQPSSQPASAPTEGTTTSAPTEDTTAPTPPTESTAPVPPSEGTTAPVPPPEDTTTPASSPPEDTTAPVPPSEGTTAPVPPSEGATTPVPPSEGTTTPAPPPSEGTTAPVPLSEGTTTPTPAPAPQPSTHHRSGDDSPVIHSGGDSGGSYPGHSSGGSSDGSGYSSDGGYGSQR